MAPRVCRNTANAVFRVSKTCTADGASGHREDQHYVQHPLIKASKTEIGASCHREDQHYVQHPLIKAKKTEIGASCHREDQHNYVQLPLIKAKKTETSVLVVIEKTNITSVKTEIDARCQEDQR